MVFIGSAQCFELFWRSFFLFRFIFTHIKQRCLTFITTITITKIHFWAYQTEMIKGRAEQNTKRLNSHNKISTWSDIFKIVSSLGRFWESVQILMSDIKSYLYYINYQINNRYLTMEQRSDALSHPGKNDINTTQYSRYLLTPSVNSSSVADKLNMFPRKTIPT